VFEWVFILIGSKVKKQIFFSINSVKFLSRYYLENNGCRLESDLNQEVTEYFCQ
jgi:hypothetical protein